MLALRKSKDLAQLLHLRWMPAPNFTSDLSLILRSTPFINVLLNVVDSKKVAVWDQRRPLCSYVVRIMGPSQHLSKYRRYRLLAEGWTLCVCCDRWGQVCSWAMEIQWKQHRFAFCTDSWFYVFGWFSWTVKHLFEAAKRIICVAVQATRIYK